MPRNLERYYGNGDLHFLTFSCYHRQPLLGTPAARNLFTDTLEELRARHQFLVVGYVVMPEHVHLLLSEPPSIPLSTALQALKQRVSRDMETGIRSRAEVPPEPPPSRGKLWQPRFHDFNVHSPWKRREKLEYTHANPVKRGLVTSPAEWMWCSYVYYQTGLQGLVTITAVP
ncbi:MAG: transposase [Candidatus Acidiferrales bacterium]